MRDVFSVPVIGHDTVLSPVNTPGSQLHSGAASWMKGMGDLDR